jgi:pilus assembly protein CpaB
VQLNRSAFLRDLMMRRPMLVGAVAAIAAALFAMGFLSEREAELLRLAESSRVIAAARDLAVGERIDEESVTPIAVPRRFCAPGAIDDVHDAASRIAVVPIRAGTQLTSAVARVPNDAAGLAALIPAGRRAVSVRIGGSLGVAGLLHPNDAVDVLATFDLGSEASVRRSTLAVVAGVQVLAVDRRLAGAPAEVRAAEVRGLFGNAMPQRPAGDGVDVTLAVTPAEAQALAFAAESGALALALRPRGEEEMKERPSPTTIATIAGGNEELIPMRRRFQEYRGRK